MGLSADFVTSEHTAKERDQLIADFRSGKIKHMCNVGVLTIGFDFPELDSITLARPTISLGLMYQMIGRGTRPSPEKTSCQVIDITENVKKLGRIETIKLEKEEGGFRDIVTTEVGEVTGVPLFTFRIKNKEKVKAIIKTKEAVGFF
jgi:DNA repair protein RadD